MAEQLNGDYHGRTPHQLILSNSNTIELPGDALKIPRRSRVRCRFFSAAAHPSLMGTRHGTLGSGEAECRKGKEEPLCGDWGERKCAGILRSVERRFSKKPSVRDRKGAKSTLCRGVDHRLAMLAYQGSDPMPLYQALVNRTERRTPRHYPV